eukprot:402258_1
MSPVRYREQHCHSLHIPHIFKTLTNYEYTPNNGTSIFQQCYSKDYCCHTRYPSFPASFPHFGNYPIDVVCLECSNYLLIKSNYAQLFKQILMNTWLDAQVEATGRISIDETYLQYLTCFIRVFSHPQIQHFMRRKRTLFARLIKIIFFGYETLQIIRKYNSDPIFSHISSEYYGFIRWVLIFCHKNHQLECVMNLKFFIGGSLWQKYVIEPYKSSNKKSPLYAYSITMIGYMVKYRECLLKNKVKSEVNNRQKQMKIQRCLMEVKNAVEQHIKLYGKYYKTQIIDDTCAYFKPNPGAIQGDLKIKLWAFFYAVKCSNKKCNRNYCFHKHGIDNFNGEWMKRIEDKLKPKLKWYICKGCHLVFYCSRKCQKIDWSQNQHKEFCQSIKL